MALMQIAEPGQSPNPHQKNLVLGIDLGTTHSLVAAVKNSQVLCLADDQGEKLLHSVVTYSKTQTVVGTTTSQDPEAVVISSIKRFIGRSSQEVQALLQDYPVSYTWDFSDPAVPKVMTPQGLKSPIEISAQILKALRQRAAQHFNLDDLNQQHAESFQAVITVPAYFDDSQRQATQAAARLAGLTVLRLINEPTAAALAYGVVEDGSYLIYDFGGGTFDASLVEKQQDVFEVVATAGDTFLGGDDIDQALTQYFLARYQSLNTKNLRNKIKQAKESLSAQDSVSVAGQTLHQTELHQVMLPILRKTHQRLQQVMLDGAREFSQLQGILLVGGSTRSPYVSEQLKELSGITPRQDVNPDEVVALGALAQARKMTSKDVKHLLLDVCPLSLGLETMGGIVERIIPRNTPIPVTKKQTFTTSKNSQSALLLHVVQGEREAVASCRSLAQFELKNLPALPAGVPRIEVQFAMDANGVLKVTAEELASGQSASVDVKPSQGLSEQALLDLLTQANQHSQADMQQRFRAGAQVELARIIEACEFAFSEDGYLLNQTETQQLKQVLQRAKSLSQDDQATRETLDAMREELNKTSEILAARRMDTAIKAALAGTYID